MHIIRLRLLFVLGASIWLVVGSIQSSMAQNTEGNLDKHRWKDRILLHWSLSGKAFSLQQQKEAAKFREELRERELVLYYVGPDAGFGPKGAISTHVADRLISAYRLPAKSSGCSSERTARKKPAAVVCPTGRPSSPASIKCPCASGKCTSAIQSDENRIQDVQDQNFGKRRFAC